MLCSFRLFIQFMEQHDFPGIKLPLASNFPVLEVARRFRARLEDVLIAPTPAPLVNLLTKFVFTFPVNNNLLCPPPVVGIIYILHINKYNANI
mgnify:CR=1 FL=1